MKERILHLTLYRKWFDEIWNGIKKEEYREIKPYWIKRLRGKTYDEIVFRNGYSPLSPWMKIKCAGIEERDGKFVIRLGNFVIGYK